MKLSIRLRQNINLTGLKFGEAAENFRHQWVCVFKTIRFCAQDHDGKRQVFKVLLARNVFVHREEDAEFAGGGNEVEKFSVLHARPACQWNSLNIVAGQIPPQTRRQTFLQKNSHSGGLRNGRQHRIGRLFKKRNSLFTGHGWKILQKIVQRVAAFEVIQQRPHGYTRAGKARFATHDFRVNFNYGACLHGIKVSHCCANDNCLILEAQNAT
jgi:hypothetical protein